MLLHNQQFPVYLRFEGFASQTGLKHFVSSRIGGKEEAEHHLNLSFKRGEAPKVLQNRQSLAQSLEIPLENFCFAQQTHSNHVQVVTEKDRTKGAFAFEAGIPDTDALVTQSPNICIVVTSADCVPLLFFDPQQKVIAAAHAGWRGTVQKIAQKTIEVMQKQFNARPEDILVGIGPCISAKVYEIGTDVEEAVAQSFGTTEKYLIDNPKTGKKHLDLVYSNFEQLRQMGVQEKHIEKANICTFERTDLFFSYRKEKEQVGIFGSGIMLKA